METQKKTKFDCECNGCRKYYRHPTQIWHQDQIKNVTNGHFFKPETMKFFKSRISDFKAVGISKSREKSLAVIVSSKWGDDSPRHYEIVLVCPYGELWRESDENGLVKYESLAKTRNSDTWKFNRSRDYFACSCHGCQLDEEGRA